MNHSHLPRVLIIMLFILVAVIFLAGSLRTFTPARAAPVLEELVQKADTTSTVGDLPPTSTSIADFLPPGPTPTPLPPSLLPPPTEGGPFMPSPPPTYTPTPAAIPTPNSAQIYITDMTGIIALAILMVVVVLVGVVLGGRILREKKGPKK